ncbi:DUF192 domain-containing protein [Blattabacterium cuenoti]|uniref:DUF192 domain-containing protein n=1 Tax=Blattabacterium cuenoti TaxID=1653831 RepID=UPI00163CA38B|nr:DUF192 domain-containing protein [Blattabacterium cuenoti]
MKKVCLSFLFFLIFLIFVSSEREENDFILSDLSESISDQLEIEFIKHGELYIKNENFFKKIDIEFASSDIEKKNGLTYRSFLKEDRGMLFLLKDREESLQMKMNMKNMRIPLDILYIDDSNTVVFIDKYVHPMMNNNKEEVDYYFPNNNIRYVLEINAGMSDKWGVKKGITKIIYVLKKDFIFNE